MHYLTLIIFIISYTLFISFPKWRPYVAVVASALLVASGIILPLDTVRHINWNVIGIFWGTLVVAELFMYSRVPAYLAEKLVNKSKTTGMAILYICILSSFLSAFVENVATVLIIAPIAFAVAQRIKVSPVPMIIGVAISSNLQGTATLIGDPPSMLLAGYSKMTFNDFFFYQGRPSIFFAVEIGAVTSFVILYFFFRKYKTPIQAQEVEKVKTWIPTWILIVLIVALALSSFFDPGFGFLAGILCMIAAFVSIIWYALFEKGRISQVMKNLDWGTTIFLMGIFIIVGALSQQGWLDEAAKLINSISGDSLLLTFIIIIGFSVVISAFVDNVPYLVAMIPVGQQLADLLGTPPSLILFGLLIGASLGGNITPIGASANIVGVGICGKKGYQVSFWEFIKMGLPFTLVAVISASIFVWFIWQ